jgi:hypothetical protein
MQMIVSFAELVWWLIMAKPSRVGSQEPTDDVCKFINHAAFGFVPASY